MTELLGESTTLGASGGVSYSWSPSDGLSCTDCRDPQVTISAPQSYYVTVTDANSCVSGDSVFVNVLNVDAVYIPNAFSPNGDGINDEFRISGNNLQSCSILVYDRWGTKVFETSDLSAGWNGDYHGARSDAAVYVYRISVTLADGETRKFNGHLTLVR